jgi:hypothetical protein
MKYHLQKYETILPMAVTAGSLHWDLQGTCLRWIRNTPIFDILADVSEPPARDTTCMHPLQGPHSSQRQYPRQSRAALLGAPSPCPVWGRRFNAGAAAAPADWGSLSGIAPGPCTRAWRTPAGPYCGPSRARKPPRPDCKTV